jgi:hypothetical protein
VIVLVLSHVHVHVVLCLSALACSISVNVESRIPRIIPRFVQLLFVDKRSFIPRYRSCDISFELSSFNRNGIESLLPNSMSSSQAAHQSMRASTRETSSSKSASLSAQSTYQQMPKLQEKFKCVLVCLCYNQVR